MIQVYGKTYPHKEKIKSLGFRWKPQDKLWQAESCDRLDELKRLSGLIIVDNNETIDNRSHKEKYGRCEDAPCCGCCGQNYYENPYYN